MSDIKRFLVCGGGMMGSAIAQILAGLDGAQVTVYDVFPVDIEAKIRNNMKLLVLKSLIIFLHFCSFLTPLLFPIFSHNVQL